MGRLFGTDGVRGVANSELTPIMAYKIGRITANILKRESVKPKIILGMDTRRSGAMLGAALSAGICSAGGDIINIGIVPTPALAFLVRELKGDAGIVITASHNTMEYNGIKIFNSEGFKLRDELEEEIEVFVFSDKDCLPSITGKDIGNIIEDYKALDLYVDYMAGIYGSLNLSGMKIAIDCAEGATYRAAPAILKRLGADLHTIHNEPNGVNINENCGSTHMEAIKKFVIENSMDIGIAFDGDGDRCLMVDEKGRELDGDQIMSVCAHFMKEQGLLSKNTLVITTMSNMGLALMARDNNINIKRTQVGDKFVLEEMLEVGAVLGGEQSGHVIFLKHNTTGDGILTALSILNVMKLKGEALSDINIRMKVMPQVLLGAKVSNTKKYDFDKVEEIKNAISLLEEAYKDRGRVLIRASGTEPLVRVMIEGENIVKMKEEANTIKELIEKHLG
ncbi:MAG: phosphoglucosamine mutase [Defluviitaleaceae bacterium]|nr:phosphoglucosamine mutase [Defluviitaleaceae bacterium]